MVLLLDSLSLERSAFAGYAWGASIGCHLGARHSERLTELVLLDAGYQNVPEDGKSLDERMAEARELAAEWRFDDWESVFASVRESGGRWSAEREERVRHGIREEDGKLVVASSPDAAAAAMHGVITEPPTQQLAAVGRASFPVLLVTSGSRAGADEGRAAVSRFRAAIPRAEVVHVEDSGHDVLAERPDLTITAVGDFLSAVDSVS